MDTVLITGAASGIGRATAELFADAGWRVYATDVDADGLDALAVDCETVRMDVTDADEVEQVVARIEAETTGIDCLVNNAGYAQLGPVEDVPTERIKQQFDVNVHGCLRTAKAVLPGMRERGRGTIVTVSSIYGKLSTPGAGAYGGSKHAIEGLSDSLRMEVASTGIDVVLVEPGWVATNFADASGSTLDGFDRTDTYDDTYRALETSSLISGGPVALPPERVGKTILQAAADPDPDARYPVGLHARLLLLTRLLPQRVQDGIVRTVYRLGAVLG